MSLDFLKKIEIVDVPTSKSGGSRRGKEKNPTIANSIRVWKNGAVYPSADLVERFSLEYGNKPAEGEKATGNAFDVFSSQDFPMIQSPTTLVFLNVCAKAAGKSDLFGSTSWNDDGTPKVSVMEQGATTFGKDSLLPLLKNVYGIEPNADGYIDVILLGTDGEAALQSFPLPAGKTICYVPKEVSRGSKAGEMSYARRENPVLFALYPWTLVHGTTSATELSADSETATEEAEEVTAEATA